MTRKTSHALPVGIPACRSCGSHEPRSFRPDGSPSDGLCDGCGHAVDHHDATIVDAYAVECHGCRAAFVELFDSLSLAMAFEGSVVSGLDRRDLPPAETPAYWSFLCEQYAACDENR